MIKLHNVDERSYIKRESVQIHHSQILLHYVSSPDAASHIEKILVTPNSSNATATTVEVHRLADGVMAASGTFVSSTRGATVEALNALDVGLSRASLLTITVSMTTTTDHTVAVVFKLDDKLSK